MGTVQIEYDSIATMSRPREEYFNNYRHDPDGPDEICLLVLERPGAELSRTTGHPHIDIFVFASIFYLVFTGNDPHEIICSSNGQELLLWKVSFDAATKEILRKC